MSLEQGILMLTMSSIKSSRVALDSIRYLSVSCNRNKRYTPIRNQTNITTSNTAHTTTISIISTATTTTTSIKLSSPKHLTRFKASHSATSISQHRPRLKRFSKTSHTTSISTTFYPNSLTLLQRLSHTSLKLAGRAATPL